MPFALIPVAIWVPMDWLAWSAIDSGSMSFGWIDSQCDRAPYGYSKEYDCVEHLNHRLLRLAYCVRCLLDYPWA